MAVRSAVVVTVPDAERAVGEWRLQYTRDAPAGMPPHVSLLFPFVPAERVDEVEQPLAGLVAAAHAFDLVFRRTARFPEVLYLDPEPTEPFLALTAAISAEWPEHPPYEGAFDTVIPHLTVAESRDQGLLDRIAVAVEAHLPVETRVRDASLFVEDDDRRWRELSRLPLGQPGVA
jgi:2'-5' RNA ligase